MAKHKIVGISFDHMHMGDLLRMASSHPDAEIVGIFDPNPEKMVKTAQTFNIPSERVFTDFNACMKAAKPDLAILCAAPADHATYTERLAKYGVHVFVEKPFAASATDARRMMAAVKPTGKILAINWPLAWVESHVKAKQMIDDGVIGELVEVHFYDGNRGPLYHLADKVEVSPEEVEHQKKESWWYKRASGGGSLLDYMGYGATLSTWYRNGEAPLEITTVVDQTLGVEVDQHSITVCRYARGLSKIETRWGTFTDPWTIQPQPTCGFIFVGTQGTISSPDYASHITVQTLARPQPTPVAVDELPVGRRNGIEYVLGCINKGVPVSGALDPELCLTAQRIIDTAMLSMQEKRTLAVLP